jgi:hypothetical protein
MYLDTFYIPGRTANIRETQIRLKSTEAEIRTMGFPNGKKISLHIVINCMTWEPLCPGGCKNLEALRILDLCAAYAANKYQCGSEVSMC